MAEDTTKRNKRIAEWQRDKRIVIILTGGKTTPEIEQAAERSGQSVNAWINDAINDKLKGD